MTVPATTISSGPGKIDVALEARLRHLCSVIGLSGEDNSLPASLALTRDERQEFDQRLRRLDDWLGPAGMRTAKLQVTRILATMPTRAGSLDDAAIVLGSYADDLADLPDFALTCACQAFRRGEKGNPQFAPTAAQIRSLATEIAEPVRKERRQIQAVLQAPVWKSAATAEGRAKAAAEIAALLDDLKRARPINEGPCLPPPPPPETEAELAARMRDKAPVTLSEVALKSVLPQMFEQSPKMQPASRKSQGCRRKAMR